MTIDLRQRYVLKEDVVLQEFDDEALLLNLKAELIFQLNETGLRIVQLLQQGLMAEDIVTTLLEEYDIEEQTVRSDVIEILDSLLVQDLIQSV